MAGNTSGNAQAICPYYRSASRQRIICEGTEEYDAGLFFRQPDGAQEWRKNYCDCYCWQGCPVAIMLTADAE